MSRRPAVGFFREGGKTRPITKPKKKRTRVVKRVKATPFDTCKREAFRLHESRPGSQVIQVAGYKGKVSPTADPRWRELPPWSWTHYVVLDGGVVHDPTARQFGADQEEKYPLEELRRRWGKLYFLTEESSLAPARRDVVPAGRCYDYAYRQAMEHIDRSDVVIVHGTVHDAWDKHPFVHAWVERDGRVYDWQTMEYGASKYAGVGWPREAFYEAFQPTDVTRYTPEEVVVNTIRQRHKGPWT